MAASSVHLQEELDQVEQKLQQLLHSEIPTVADLGRYLLESGGKRFRPALTLLFYKLLGSRGSRSAVIELAAILEMIHLATLAHDDVIDQAHFRRSRPTLWMHSSNRSAVLEGDFIFSRALRLLNTHPFEIRSLIIDAVEHLLEGELLQESLRGQIPSAQDYDQVIEGKTAALMGAACAIGALLGDPALARWQRDSVQRVGILLGAAYQMIDDLLDVFGNESIGKPTWTDRQGGWFTWPYIRLLQQAKDPRLGELLRKEDLSEEEKVYILDQMARHEIREQFHAKARQKIEEAKGLLSWIEDSDLRELLTGIMDFVIARKS